MANLAMELSHLEQADRNIARARQLIAEAEERETESPAQSETAGASLITMKGTLMALEGHRALIVQAVADIRAGVRRSS